MRTYQEINADVERAKGLGDSEALFRLSDEMQELGTPEGVAQSHNSLGAAEFLTGDLPAGLEQFQRAVQLYDRLGDRFSAAGVKGNIGNVYGMTGDFPVALDHYQQTLDILEELGERSSAARILGNIGNVYTQLGDHPTALEYLHRALEIVEELGKRSMVAMVVMNIGLVHSTMGNNPVALEHLYRALDMYEGIGGEGILHTSSIIAFVLLSENRLEEAIALLDENESIKMQNTAMNTEHLANRAKALELSDDLEAAHLKYLEAIEVARSSGFRIQQTELHKKIRDLAQKRNDFAAYIEHNNEYARIAEEINGKDTSTKLAVQAKQREIDAREREYEKQLAVLHSTLPKEIADRVARGETVSDQHENATVIFLDIVGFTTNSSDMESGDVTKLLACVFEHFDAACDQYSVTKIKTIGDSYMAVGFDDPVSSASLALAMNASEFSWPDGSPLQYRIGMHSGPVTAGVIGTQRMQYDVWGDTVNVASRMESSGEAGRIQVSEVFARSSALQAKDDRVEFVERGEIDIKGKGKMKTFWLVGALR